MRNPAPHFFEATDAASKITVIKRDLFVLKAEIEAIRQLRRFALVILSGASFVIGVALLLFWMSQSLHDRGWPAPWVGIASFLLLTAVALALLGFAYL